VWWYVPVIPANWKIEVGGLRFKASLGKVNAYLSAPATIPPLFKIKAHA
jgi:hypothetical protein